MGNLSQRRTRPSDSQAIENLAQTLVSDLEGSPSDSEALAAALVPSLFANGMLSDPNLGIDDVTITADEFGWRHRGVTVQLINQTISRFPWQPSGFNGTKVISAGKFGAFRLGIRHDMDNFVCVAHTTHATQAYNTAQAAIDAMPADFSVVPGQAQGFVTFGWLVIEAGGSQWASNADNLTTAASATVYSAPVLPGFPIAP